MLGEVFVKERDIFLTNSLQLACHFYPDDPEPTRVVGVVGLGHTPGIVENWGKVEHSDIPPLMRYILIIKYLERSTGSTLA